MHTHKLICPLVAVFSFGSLIACTGEDLVPSNPITATLEAGVATGERGGPCYANRTCNEGLTCVDDVVCVTKDITGKPVAPDAGSPSDAGGSDASDADAGQCKKVGTFAANSVKPAAPKSASCMDWQIAQLAEACFKDAYSSSCLAARNAQATCAACALGVETDPQWKPILAGYPNNPAYYNVAGCVANVSGNAYCAQKYVQVMECFDRYCDACAGASETSCQKDVAQNECKPYLLDQQCGDVVLSDAVDAKCIATGKSDAERKAHFISLVTVACK